MQTPSLKPEEFHRQMAALMAQAVSLPYAQG
jgi:hypothetical protein